MGGGQEPVTKDSIAGDANLTGHLLLAWPVPEETHIIARIQQQYPNLRITFLDSSKDTVTPEQWASATVISTFATLPAKPSDVPALQFIHLLSAGSNHLTSHPIYTDSTIPLTTSSGIHGPTISEWVIMALLSHAHHLPMLLSWQASRRWIPSSESHASLAGVHDHAGQTIGILGYGSIGRQTARVAQALGMRVLAYTASPRPDAESKKDHGFIVPGTGDADGSVPSAWFSGLDKTSLHAFLSEEIDVLVVSVPLTTKTRHFLGTAEFELLGRKAGRKPFIVNIARGQLLVQAALLEALKLYESSDGKEGIRGAAVDVTDPEPLPDGDELWTAPNVFVSPHISGLCEDYRERAALVLEGNLERLRKGEPLWNEVDRERGY